MAEALTKNPSSTYDARADFMETSALTEFEKELGVKIPDEWRTMATQIVQRMGKEVIYHQDFIKKAIKNEGIEGSEQGEFVAVYLGEFTKDEENPTKVNEEIYILNAGLAKKTKREYATDLENRANQAVDRANQAVDRANQAALELQKHGQKEDAEILGYYNQIKNNGNKQAEIVQLKKRIESSINKRKDEYEPSKEFKKMMEEL